MRYNYTLSCDGFNMYMAVINGLFQPSLQELVSCICLARSRPLRYHKHSKAPAAHQVLLTVSDLETVSRTHHNWRLNAPIMAQFLVLGIRRVSHSTSQPQCRLNDASHIRDLEYELSFFPNPPRFKLSMNNSSSGMWYVGAFERSYFASKLQAQQGIDRYPAAETMVDTTGTHGVSSSAWLPMMNTPGLKYGSSIALMGKRGLNV